MATHKFFSEPKFHDEAFYQDREAVDHLRQPKHRERLLRTLHDTLYLLAVDIEATSVCDFGCGTGGMLHELKKARPDITSWGYDLSPKAVDYAREKYGVDATLQDFTKAEVRFPDIAVMTETMEHLVSPEEFLQKLRDGGVKWLVASVPLDETPDEHYEFHLWAWDKPAFADLFARMGLTVVAHYNVLFEDCQHLIALNGSAFEKTGREQT